MLMMVIHVCGMPQPDSVERWESDPKGEGFPTPPIGRFNPWVLSDNQQSSEMPNANIDHTEIYRDAFVLLNMDPRTK